MLEIIEYLALFIFIVMGLFIFATWNFFGPDFLFSSSAHAQWFSSPFSFFPPLPFIIFIISGAVMYFCHRKLKKQTKIN